MTSALSAPTPALTLGLDLTGLGAKAPVHTRARLTQPGSQRVSLGDVSDYLELAAEAEISLVTFGEAFRLDDIPRPDAWLDPAVLVSRLAAADLLHGSATLVAALPSGLLDPVRLARGVAGLHIRTAGRAGWQVRTAPTSGGVHGEVRRTWAADRALATSAPLLVTSVDNDDDAALAGRHSDVVRLRVETPEQARRLRELVRAAARSAGRAAEEVRVLVDAQVVIGEDSASAAFRADLLREVAETPQAAAPLTVAGTAAEVADALTRWADVVDGFVLVPGSLPTDVLAITRHLVPELARRGLVPAVGAKPALGVVNHA